MIVVLIIAMLLAIGIPNFLRAKEMSRARTCQSNLHEIVTAKEQWAMDNRMVATSVPLEEDLVSEYIKSSKDNSLPTCPSNGTYVIGSLATDPVCLIGSNVSPEDWDDHTMIH